MTRTKSGIKYITIKIPDGLAKKIDELVAESKHDFTSRTDVIKFAVRLLHKQKTGEY